MVSRAGRLGPMTPEQTLAECLRRDFPTPALCDEFIDSAPVPVRVIDCVLSLNRPYDSVVLPRVTRFRERHPGARTLDDLANLAAGYPTPAKFLHDELDMKDPKRAEVLLGVVNYLRAAQARFAGATEEDRLRAWALDARPGDHLSTGVGGFALAGFQYLRLLLGAETAKPDVHIIRYVARALGRKVTDVEALLVLEKAAALNGVSARRYDRSMWQAGARPDDGSSASP